MATTSDDNPLADYLPDEEMAKLRGVTTRTQRSERQRGVGPPFCRDSKRIYYHLPTYREWLLGNTQPRPDRGHAAKRAAKRGENLVLAG